MPIPVRTEPPTQVDDGAKAPISARKHDSGHPIQYPSTSKHHSALPRPPSLAHHATRKTVKQHTIPTAGTIGPSIVRSRSLAAQTNPRAATSSSGRGAACLASLTQVPLKSEAPTTDPNIRPRTLGASTRAPSQVRPQNDRGANPAAARAGGHTRPSPSTVAFPPVKKPAFNTYNKQYSPQKIINRPAVSSSRVTPVAANLERPPQSTEPANADRALADELLQLRLLHDNAGRRLREFEANISTLLGASHEAVAADVAAMEDMEYAQRFKLNVRTLMDWRGQAEHLPTTQTGHAKLLVVAYCVKELHETIQEDGPLHNIMKEFSQWYSHVLVASRGRNGDIIGDQPDQPLFAGPLDASWAALVDSVKAKINSCRDSLADLQELSDETSISSLITMHLRLATQTLQAIGTCRVVEGLILQREQDWTQVSLTNAIAEAERHYSAQCNPRGDRTGLWNTFAIQGTEHYERQ